MGAKARLSHQLHFADLDRIGTEKTGFTLRVRQLLNRIDCQRADSPQQKNAIFRLRYKAYRSEDAISPNSTETFSDLFDEMANAYLFGLYIEGNLASSIRIHVCSKEYPHSPSIEAFPDILQPELNAGKIIIDPTRFVADEGLSRIHRGLPYATLRLSMVAAEHFGADLVLAAVRTEHQAFYQRAFSQRVICDPRPYPQLAVPLSLMAIHYPTAADALHRQYPFIPSTLTERRMLFERQPRAGRTSAVTGAGFVELGASSAVE